MSEYLVQPGWSPYGYKVEASNLKEAWDKVFAGFPGYTKRELKKHVTVTRT